MVRGGKEREGLYPPNQQFRDPPLECRSVYSAECFCVRKDVLSVRVTSARRRRVYTTTMMMITVINERR